MKHLKTKTSFSRPQLLVFLLAFSLIGYLIFRSFALNPSLPGDLNGDNTVNIQDLSILLSNYNTANAAADINGDGTVNVLDLSILLSHYGQSLTQAVPSIPTGLTATPGDSSVALKWTANPASDSVDTYQVYWTTDSAWATNSNNLNVTGTSFTVSGLSNGATYYFRISAHNSTGYGPWGTAISSVPVASGGGGGIASTCGSLPTPPVKYNHVVWVWMENKTYDSVMGSGAASAPYINSLKAKCGFGTQYLDNAEPDLPSEPNYLAATSGSNCNSGNDTAGSGCIIDDNDPSAHTLSTVSIFQQLEAAGLSWKAYQEYMPANCGLSGSGQYAVKHNPPAYYTNIRSSCGAKDVPFPGIACNDTSCPVPASGSLDQDITNGALPSFSFITPGLCNDMHDCSVATGDQWAKVWLPKLIGGKNYLAGDTAIFLMWDEGSANQPIPNIFITPYTPVNGANATAFNHFAVLRGTEKMLGLSSFLGCASGTAPGGSACPAGSTVDIRTLFHM